MTTPMGAPVDARDTWILERTEVLTGRRLDGRPFVTDDTTDFMAIDRDHVVELAGRLYLVTGIEREKRFGLADEPKFWVKRAVALDSGEVHILKMVFREVFKVRIRDVEIRCVRSAEKEGRVLDVTADDLRFMHGRVMADRRGNPVRVIDFIRGTDLLTWISSLRMAHEEYFRTEFALVLRKTVESLRAIQTLHDAGLCHGDIRNDHILVEQGTGRFRWIDFDLMQDDTAFDVWTVGNILHCVVGKGFVTFQEVTRDRPELRSRLSSGDGSEFFPNRVMNLRKVFPHVPERLNDVLMRFSSSSRVLYDRVAQVVEDLEPFAAPWVARA